jgi:hypothetical protein
VWSPEWRQGLPGPGWDFVGGFFEKFRWCGREADRGEQRHFEFFKRLGEACVNGLNRETNPAHAIEGNLTGPNRETNSAHAIESG